MNATGHIFEQQTDSSFRPLAERARPHKLEDIFGHKKYLSADASLYNQIKSGKLPSLVLWGPPGVGKTTLARVIAKETGYSLRELSAVSSGVKEVKSLIEQARHDQNYHQKKTILFIDEIHRFNKAQQDALLHATEQGIIILIGATTENPSFEVTSALLSRCTVIKLEYLGKADIQAIIDKVIREDEILSKSKIKIENPDALIFYGSGDARKTLNLLESSYTLADKEKNKVVITEQLIKKAAAHEAMAYDKKGDYHYDTISAFIKSVRGSDPNAAVYWLARMLDGGEDPLFVARRLIILASEDIGNAEPYALMLANAAFESVAKIGMPEARIILAQASTFLASCPKSNAAYLAIQNASEEINTSGLQPVPLHLRNAPTSLMKNLHYAAQYKYAHDYPNHFVKQNYLPESLVNKIYYRPTDLGREGKMKEYLKKCWPEKYKKDKT